MTLDQTKRLLDGFLAGLTSSLGFDRTESLRYARQSHDATVVLSFPCRLSARGVGLFTVWLGVRFESLAMWLDDDPAERPPTFIRPIHLLRDNKSITEWEFSNVDDLEKLRDTILSDLREYALPFAERYCRLAELRKTLESPNKQDWIGIGLDVDTRVTTLAAIRFVGGDKAGAIRTLEDAIKTLDETLASRPHELRKRRFGIDYLRKRLSASG